MGLDEEIVIPDPRPPRKQHNQHAKIYAEEHQHKEREALQPHGSRGMFGFVGAACGRGQHAGFAIRK